MFRVDEFRFEVLDIVVIECEAPLQGAVRHSAFALEQFERL
jgi:hypothetical protein